MAIKRDPRGRGRGANPPKIYVELKKADYWGKRFAEAQIRLRSGCYRYLVWRDGERKREFYLGKVKTLAPRRSSPASKGSKN